MKSQKREHKRVEPVEHLEDAKTPGERVRKLMAMAGFTLTDFAEVVGIPNSSLSSLCSARDMKWENHLDRLSAIAKFLNVKEDFFWTGEGIEEVYRVFGMNGQVTETKRVRRPSTSLAPKEGLSVRVEKPSSDYRIQEVSRLMQQVSPAVQRAILAAVRALVDAIHDEGGSL